jgi:iron complex transport system permease protein
MEAHVKKRNRKYWTIALALIALLISFMALKRQPWKRACAADDLFCLLRGESPDETSFSILWKIRLPRMISAAILGGALALSGFLLQTFFNNPIAGPYVLGISSGAKLVVAIVMVCVLGASRAVGSVALIGAAFVGALLSMSIVLMMSQKVRSAAMLIVCA